MIVEIDKYCRRTGTTPETLMRVATGDGRLWAGMKSGRELTLKMIERIRQTIKDNPDGIPAKPCGRAAHKSKFS